MQRGLLYDTILSLQSSHLGGASWNVYGFFLILWWRFNLSVKCAMTDGGVSMLNRRILRFVHLVSSWEQRLPRHPTLSWNWDLIAKNWELVDFIFIFINIFNAISEVILNWWIFRIILPHYQLILLLKLHLEIILKIIRSLPSILAVVSIIKCLELPFRLCSLWNLEMSLRLEPSLNNSVFGRDHYILALMLLELYWSVWWHMHYLIYRI